MSIALSGVTFSKQMVTPSDDGALYGCVLTDGILNGVNISYSAASLLVTAGRLIIGTRECKIDTNITLAVDGATSGFARVKLTVDLTQTATKEVFSQVYADVEYSATLGGFPSLVQQDINTAGTTYEAVLAVLTMGTAGITGIVDKLPRAQMNPKMVDVTIPVSAWTLVPDPPAAGLSYRATVSNALFNERHMPVLIFYPDNKKAWEPYSFNGGVHIYSSSVPAESVTLAAICAVR